MKKRATTKAPLPSDPVKREIALQEMTRAAARGRYLKSKKIPTKPLDGYPSQGRAFVEAYVPPPPPLDDISLCQACEKKPTTTVKIRTRTGTSSFKWCDDCWSTMREDLTKKPGKKR